jgi:hypothetical protein
MNVFLIAMSLMLAEGFTANPDAHTTLVFPPYGHCMGIYRAGQEQLSMLLGGMITFDDPQGLVAVLPDEWDTSDPGDDDELAAYGVNSGSGHIIYNASMYTLGFYGGEGSGPDQLSSPHGIDATTSGTVYVADTGNRRVAVLKRSGQRLSPDTFIEGFVEPWDVALDGRYIWVTDRAAGTLSRYTSPADANPAVISLIRPSGVAATGYGEYSNGHSPCQVVITEGGTVLSKIEDGVLTAAVGLEECGGSFFNYVEIDYHGNVWVTDSISCMIHKFDPELNYLDSWGDGYGDSDTRFMNPTGIAIWDRFGQVFVAESSGARYFWVGADIRDLDFSSDGNGCTVSGMLTETALMVVNIYRADGSIARSLYSGRRSPGNFSMEWDGKTLQGQRVFQGEFTISVNIEPVYSSRTYFEKTWTQNFHMNGEPEPENTSRERLR